MLTLSINRCHMNPYIQQWCQSTVAIRIHIHSSGVNQHLQYEPIQQWNQIARLFHWAILQLIYAHQWSSFMVIYVRRNPEAYYGRGVQDCHLDYHTAPKLWKDQSCQYFTIYIRVYFMRPEPPWQCAESWIYPLMLNPDTICCVNVSGVRSIAATPRSITCVSLLTTFIMVKAVPLVNKDRLNNWSLVLLSPHSYSCGLGKMKSTSLSLSLSVCLSPSLPFRYVYLASDIG